MQKSTQIQGLRALSVLLVLLFHANWLPGGYIGVDVFYVISGFLITGLIIKDTNFKFSTFYARRAKRLLPAAYLVLAVTALIFWLVAPSISLIQFSRDLFSSTWYFSNINFAFWQNEYQNLGANPSPLIHYWSLAVEEQFYLIWPLIIIIFRRRFRTALLFLSFISFISALILVGEYPIWNFYLLPTRAFELGIGALLSIYNLKFSAPRIGISLIILSSLIFNDSSNFPGLPALLPLLGAALIVSGNGKNLLLDNSVAQRIGDWSYSIYLWHWPILILPTYVTKRPLSNPEKLLALIFTIGLSALTYYFVEAPIRSRNLSKRSVFIATLISLFTLTSAAYALNGIGNSAAESFNLTQIQKQPKIYADGCQLDKKSTEPNPNCIYGDVASKRSVVLLGDSHAAQWFPAIESWAKNRKFKLIVMTKSSCPASNIPLEDDGAFKAKNCNTYRANAITEIVALKPILLIVGSAENHKNIEPATYLNLPRTKSKILVLQDTPWPNQDIPTCLANQTNADSSLCDMSKPKQIPYPGFLTFDPIPYLCKENFCPAVVDGIIAYRDHSHISVAMALHLSKVLGMKLDEVVAG